jgi:hypothetical protein
LVSRMCHSPVRKFYLFNLEVMSVRPKVLII